MVKRRLAAIMFTDIEGYTALMQKSEEQALYFRKTHREIFKMNTEKFHGEIIQYYGDGTLSIFESAVDAVHCGIAMQRAFQEDPCIPVRIGIHSGDIVISDEDIIGDCVNVASRVESLAVSGSVLISDKVFDEIKNSSTIKTTYLDAFKLKNVKRPLGIYAISNEGLVVPAKNEISGKLEKEKKISWLGIAGIIIGLLILIATLWGDQFLPKDENTSNTLQSMLVLPFENYTGRDDLDYFVNGMHSSLIGDLGRISAMRVISPTTSRAYADSGKSLPEIAEELNVSAILEVAVHCLGDSICVQPKLTRVYPEEQQIWVQDYYEDKSEILNLYHSLTKEISERTNASLTPEEEILLAESRTVDTTAYDLYLKGQFNLDQINKSSLQKAFQYFKLATEIDPDWAPPYAGMASVIQYQMQMGFVSPSIAIPKINEYLNITLKLDSNSSLAYHKIAVTAVWSEWDWEKGEAAFLKAIELNPNNSYSRMFYAHLLTILRRTDEALKQAAIAKELDPLRPFNLGLYAKVLNEAGRCEDAMTQAEKALSIEPDHYFVKFHLLAALECVGDYDKAFEVWKEINFARWEEYEVTETFEEVFQKQGWLAVIKEAIRINEEVWAKDGHMDELSQAGRYLRLKKYDEAVALFEKEYESHNPNLPYISQRRTYDQLKHHPGYLKLLKKMNLPVE
ncbi:MAG: hypothetical protein KJO53_01890 [Eudoraea sp.]|nr:hypothetical protein [Eudoraea sp.]MBT8292394.1 hypothetical protein [Eudoraea sp.]